MKFWFFGKSKTDNNKDFHHLYNELSNSFSVIREDVNQIGNWIEHFQQKHDNHETKFNELLKRLHKIEMVIEGLQEKLDKEGSIFDNGLVKKDTKEPNLVELKQDLWESLTEGQQKICAVLAAIHKEFPDQWIPLKYLAEELYPDKDYSRIRSTISQFITTLEEMGLVKRRRRGKQTYIFSSEKNPCLQKPYLLKQTAKILKRKKPN